MDPVKAAAAEVEARVAESEAVKKSEEPTERSLLKSALDAINALLGKGTKADAEDETEAVVKSEGDGEDETETAAETADEAAQAAGEGEFFDGLVKSIDPQVAQEYLDAQPLLEVMANEFAKTVGRYEVIKSQNAALTARIESQDEALVAIAKGIGAMLAQMDRIAEQPVSQTNPGVVVVDTASGEPAASELTKSQMTERLQKAVTEKRIDGEAYERLSTILDSRGVAAVARLLPAGA